MTKAMFITMVVLGIAVSLMAQEASKFNGTWKGDGGQVRKLTFKDGIVFMEETQTNGSVILRQYPTLAADDIRAALSYAAWLAHEEEEQPLHTVATE